MKANKSAKGRIRNKILIIAIIISILLVTRISSLTISNHEWSPTSAYTNNTINCSWAYSADTTAQNITLLNNSVIVNNSFENASLVTLSTWIAVPPESTTKGEIWTCRITLFNDTDSLTSEKNLTILNTAPTTEGGTNGIFYNSQDIGYLFNVLEDTVYTLDVNASDSDGDTLTYLPSDLFCTRTSSTLGTYNCNATQEYLIDNNLTQVNMTFTVTDNQNPGGRTVTFNITPVNDAPYFSPSLSSQSVNETRVFNYAIYGRDEEDNAPLNFSISVSPPLDLTINITSNTSAIIMYGSNTTLPSDSSGNYTVNVTIYDSLGANSTSSFTLRINETDISPVLDFIPNQSGTQGQPFSFDVYANDPDVGDNLSFSIFLSQVCVVSNPWTIITIDSSHNATGRVNITNLTNDHVICSHVNITVFKVGDGGAGDYQDVFLNISNTNDPPNVEVLSSYSNNTGGNNISNLVAYAESLFVYLVNATDLDTYTNGGEVLTFSDDTDVFDINASTGLIRFTPTQGDVGSYAILINVTDDGSPNSGPPLGSSRTMNLEIINNSAPALTEVGGISCAEDYVCFISINAVDADGDNLSFTSSNNSVFNLTNNNSQSPRWSAYVNYTPDQDFVGTHSILITVTDIRGASDTEAILFTINNTNDPPLLGSINFPSKIVETHPVSFYVFADDEDYDLPSSYATIDINGINLTEYVNFSVTNLSNKKLFNLTTQFNASNNKTYTILTFSPQLDEDSGNYSVNISATDYAGAVDWVVKNFTVHSKANPPNITQIMPYGRPVNTSTIFDFISTGYFNGGKITSINFSENRSVLYNLTVTDEVTLPGNMLYYWFINGTLNSTNPYLNISYDFFSEGKHNLTVVVANDVYENTSWTWNISVDDINRAPLLLTSLRNITINNDSIQDCSYLQETSALGVHFIDLDDDPSGNNKIDGAEISHLQYTVAPNCSVASITIGVSNCVNTNTSVLFTPIEIGSCIVFFTATDYGNLSKLSNAVTINVTAVSNSTNEVEVQRSSGGGGSSRSKSIVIPIKKEENKPRAIEIVVPNLVTIYENHTVLIPVTIKNTWNSSLKEVKLNASTNSSIDVTFTDSYFEELKVGESRDVTIMVDNYRLGNNYEIKITANVTTPLASDSALVMLNTIEQAETGPDVETKVTFAQDLLRENPECIELNELLERAKTELSTGSKQEAFRMVDAVINGCKYMVSISKKTDQQPQSIVNKFFKKENLKYLLIFAGMAAVALVTVFAVRKRRASIIKGEKKEEASENEKKEDVKPYWPGSSG